MPHDGEWMSPLKSDRAQRIEVATKDPSAKSEMGKHPVVIGGQKQMFDVFKLPVSLLAFNIRNGRFAAELRAKERELGRTLDSLVAEDEAIIRKLLLELDPGASELLKNDLKKIGQTDPGIITHDGFVINGNRRMAILKALHEEDASGKYAYLEVQVLPKGIGEKDLWKIEAGLQLSRDKRLEYGPVNDLLKIREGLRSGLTEKEIAATLYGLKDADEVKQKDERLKLIDNYLEYIGEAENYTKVNGKVEHFINLQDLQRLLITQGVKPKERHQWLLAAFELIRVGFGHMDIRALRQISKSDSARTHFLGTIKPKAGKRNAKEEDTAKEQAEEQFKIASDYVELEKEAEKPESLVKKAQRAAETVVKHRDDIISRHDLHSRVDELAVVFSKLAADCKSARTRKKK
jgi:hypothetical protein